MVEGYKMQNQRSKANVIEIKEDREAREAVAEAMPSAAARFFVSFGFWFLVFGFFVNNNRQNADILILGFIFHTAIYVLPSLYTPEKARARKKAKSKKTQHQHEEF